MATFIVNISSLEHDNRR